MGGALAWLQSQFLIGCRLGNGTSDLIYPFYAPLAVRALCSRPCTTSQHTFFSPPCHSSLRALTPLLVSRFFFISSSPSSHKCDYLHAEQVRKSSQATLLAAAVLLANTVSYHISMQCSNSENINETQTARLHSCPFIWRTVIS